MSFTNRALWSKVTQMWFDSSEWQRVLLVSAFMKAAGLVDVQAMHVSLGAPGGDPLYVVQGRKSAV